MTQGISNIHDAVIERLFHASADNGYRFGRSEINAAAKAVAGEEIANAGDLIYSYRYRRPFPSSVARTTPKPKDGAPAEWALRLRGRIKGNTTVAGIVSDATTVLARAGKLSDEQALLARARSADLIAEALGLSTALAFHSNKRTTHEDFGQIEIDEIYVGTDDDTGQKFVIPVQVKTGSDLISIVQVEQDWKWCRQQFGPAGWEVVPLGVRPLTNPSARGPLDVAVYEFRLDVPAPQAVSPHGDFAAVEHRYRIT